MVTTDLAKKSGWNNSGIKVSDFPNLLKTNRTRMALYSAFHPVNSAKIVRKGAILTNFPNSGK